jgi:NADH-quinone oxidoreductase subunit J
MDLPFVILIGLTGGSAAAVVAMRNLVHSALFLALNFAGLAGMYLYLGAQFIGLVQILVYVGAVAVLVVFAILLTRSGGAPAETVLAPSWLPGMSVAVLVFGTLTAAILGTSSVHKPLPAEPEVTVARIGHRLMGEYVLALEVAGLLLTAALLGAVLIALHEEKK